MVMAGGDGQEACVGQYLPQELRVAVFWGNQPLTGKEVTFTVKRGSATVTGSPAPIGPDGIAACKVMAGSLNSANASPIEVHAVLLAPANVPAPPPVVFTARFIDAACVYVGGDVCPQLNLGNDDRTVSAILGHFCKHVPKPTE